MKRTTFQSKAKQRRDGSALVEFALIAPFMITLLAGSFSLGMGLNRVVQARQAVRNANVLQVRGYDLSTVNNQRLIVRASMGLGMSMPTGEPFTPNPNGKAVVILTTVRRVGPIQCSQGINNWNGNPSSCPNYGLYVITRRLKIGNQTRWTSKAGNPSSTPDANGKLTDAQVTNLAGNRATGFPAMLELALDEYTFLSEMYVDTNDISMFPIINPVGIYVRNFS
jgi:hypothetical protein